MYSWLEICFIIAVTTEFYRVLASSSPGEGTGQKAHFSLKDTPGSFSVLATKILAKISSKPDSVHIIVKPGMAEFPVPKSPKTSPTEKPLLHVVSPAIVKPVGGWNFMSFGKKRSIITSGRNASSSRSVYAGGNHKRFEIIPSRRPRSKLMVRSVQTGSQSRNRQIDSSAGNCGKRVGDNLVETGKKREQVERKMNVKGGTGKLNLQVGKKLAKISSTTGGVEIFIKNPSPKQISQSPREMLQLPGTMLQLLPGISPSYGKRSQSFDEEYLREPRLPSEAFLAPVRSSYDRTRVLIRDSNDN